MPVSGPYLSAMLANIRLAPLNTLLNALPQLESQLIATGMNQQKVALLLSTYKNRALNYLTTQVQIAENEATAHALASAVESDDKNSQLTLIIEGIIVNPVAETNALEETAMLATGTQAATQLNNLIQNATQELS